MCTFMMRAGWPARCHQQYLSDAKNRTGTARTTAQACRARLVWLAPTAEAAEAVCVWGGLAEPKVWLCCPQRAPRHSPESPEHYRRRPATPRTASSASRCIPPRWAFASPPSGGGMSRASPVPPWLSPRAAGGCSVLGGQTSACFTLHSYALCIFWPGPKSGRGTSACPSQVAPSHPAPPWAGIASAPTGEVWMFAALGG
jgi:hypothetical protein